MTMKVPEITHLQFFVIGTLMNGEVSGKHVRAELRQQGVRKSGPAFYQLMARLEDSGFVSGRYDQKVIDGQIIKERRYKLCGKGVQAWERTRDFYLEQARLVSQGGLSSV